MIERHVNFDVFADKTQDFEKIFMVIRFETIEAVAAWRASPEHQALSPRLKGMYSGSQLKVFEVLA